jgi:hypothetical protein
MVEYANEEDYESCRYYSVALVCGVCGWVDWRFIGRRLWIAGWGISYILVLGVDGEEGTHRM